MRKNKNYNGYTAKTPDNLQLDAGAFFLNFIVGTDTYSTAKAAGKLLGATQGGGEFKATPEIRNTEIDGVKSRVVGLVSIDGWETYLKATLIEVTKESISKALAVASIKDDFSETYTEISGKQIILDTDHISNVTWVGHIAGYDNPIIIQVYNALNESGLTLAVSDKAEGKIEVTFFGYNTVEDYSSEEIIPPFKIYYPKTVTAPVEGG